MRYTSKNCYLQHSGHSNSARVVYSKVSDNGSFRDISQAQFKKLDLPDLTGENEQLLVFKKLFATLSFTDNKELYHRCSSMTIAEQYRYMLCW